LTVLKQPNPKKFLKSVFMLVSGIFFVPGKRNIDRNSLKGNQKGNQR
jgi:hypothetical protein